MDINTFAQQACRLRQHALTASRYCGADDSEAEDVAQEIMIKLWQMHDELTEGRRLLSLTAIIARNLTVDSMRRKHNAPIEKVLTTATVDGNPHSKLVESDDEKWLEKRMKNLPTTQYTILKMRQVEQRETEEIAQILGMKYSSVVSLLSKARHTLLEEIRRRNRQ